MLHSRAGRAALLPSALWLLLPTWPRPPPTHQEHLSLDLFPHRNGNFFPFLISSLYMPLHISHMRQAAKGDSKTSNTPAWESSRVNLPARADFERDREPRSQLRGMEQTNNMKPDCTDICREKETQQAKHEPGCSLGFQLNATIGPSQTISTFLEPKAEHSSDGALGQPNSNS